MPVPGEQFGEPADGMVGDAGKDVSEPGLGIDVVETACLDQRISNRRALTAAIGTTEQPRFASEWHTTQ